MSSETLDAIMERASHALVSLDYLSCEAACLEALGQARRAQAWSYYARILLPLQEARRQRRMIASDGGAWHVVVDTAVGIDGAGDGRKTEGLVGGEDEKTAGCLVLTQPNTPADAKWRRDRARRRRQCVEVLFADNAIDASTWTLRAYAGPAVSCTIESPPNVAASNQSTDARNPAASATSGKPRTSVTSEASTGCALQAVDIGWYLHASECLGDAAIARVEGRSDTKPGSVERVTALERMLDVVDDHEKLHQRLAEAASAVGGS